MGEAKRKQTATQKFIAKYPDCYFCGGVNPSTTRDHVPPKALFDESHRPDGLVMPACDACNRETSTADLVAAIISRWKYQSDPRTFLDHRKLSAQIKKQAPELLGEWMSVLVYGKENARRHLQNRGVDVPVDAGLATIGPLSVRQLNLFAHKVTLALYFHHFRVPLDRRGAVWAAWKTKEDFSMRGVPNELLGMFSQYGTLAQGKWSTEETFEYRYDCNKPAGLFGCIAKFREGLFVIGLAVTDRATIASLVDDESEWVSPAGPLELMAMPRLQSR